MLKLFGAGKKQSAKKEITDILNEVLEKGGFSLSFQVSEKKEGLNVDIFGEDEGLLKTRDGRLLQAFQTYFLCILKKRFPESQTRVVVDSNGFWEEKQRRLFDLVDELVEKAIQINRPVVLKKTLNPNERRLIHEKISDDKRVKSLSFGEGFYKNIKFVPISDKAKK